MILPGPFCLYPAPLLSCYVVVPGRRETRQELQSLRSEEYLCEFLQ